MNPEIKGFRCRPCSDKYYKATAPGRIQKYALALLMIVGAIINGIFWTVTLLTATSTFTRVLVGYGISLFLGVTGIDLMVKTRPPKRR